MSDKKRILIQLDTDPQPSVFDRVVAVDAGVDELFSYGGVTPDRVQPLVHGAIFTRGPKDLKHTAIFVGGSDVAAGELVLAAVRKCFFGPLRVSLMLDSNGANTTAVAAVLTAAREQPLRGAVAIVLGGTGPVGQRAVRLLAREGAIVRVGSRDPTRAQTVCQRVRASVPTAQLDAVGTGTAESLQSALAGVQIVIAAGAAGAVLLPRAARLGSPSIRVAVDLNAVAPFGIEGVECTDGGVDRDGVKCHGAIAAGGLKMKIHKAAIRRLFEANDGVLDADDLFEIGRQLQP